MYFKKKHKMEPETKNKIKFWIISLVILLLLLTNTYTYWLYNSNKNMNYEPVIITQKIDASAQVKQELIALQDQFNNLNTNDKKLQQGIEDRRIEVTKMINEADKHKNDKYHINKLQKETVTLRSIMKSYVRTIDSLGQLNLALREEKQLAVSELENEKNKINSLLKDKENLQLTVKQASKLKLYNIKAFGVKFKKNGTLDVLVEKAKKIEKIKVTFTILENKLAQAGQKLIYIRILNTKLEELSKNKLDENKFKLKDSLCYFSGKQAFNYGNATIDAVIFCESAIPYISGTYNIDICCDNEIIGSTTLKLE